jgi:hypothetical protein
MPNPTTPNWVQKLSAALKADPKRTGAAAVLLAILVAMAGKTLLRGGPGKSTPAAASAGASRGSGSARNGGGDKNASGGSLSRYSAAAAVALQNWADAPPVPVSRNVFAVNMDYFPMEGSRTAQSDAPEDGFWVKLEKSLAQQTDQRIKHENLVASYAQQASELKLQSIVMGSQPKAMLNGELVGEGSIVAGFRVLKIEARRLIVEREGIRLEIQMK